MTFSHTKKAAVNDNNMQKSSSGHPDKRYPAYQRLLARVTQTGVILTSWISKAKSDVTKRSRKTATLFQVMGNL